MIEVENASFAYPDAQPVFYNVSFRVEAGEILAVMGANGIGKTTLIKCIMGFLRLQTGKVFIGRKRIERSDMEDKTFWNAVAYVPQAKKSVFGYQVKEMVVLGRNASVGFGRVPSKRDYECVDTVLERLGIIDLREKSCNQLSGGELQMVLLARALVKNPEVLILDEPESNLDLRNQMRVLSVIEKLAHEDARAVILNTHFPTNALKISDTALLLKGDSYLFGKSSDSITEENIRAFFKIACSIVSVRAEGKTVKGIIPIGAL